MIFLDWEDGIHVQYSYIAASSLDDEGVNISLENGINETVLYPVASEASPGDWKTLLPGFSRLTPEEKNKFYDALNDWMDDCENEHADD